MPRLLWVGPFVDQWRVTDDASDSTSKGVFDGQEMALDWACRLALGMAPCLVRLQNEAGAVTAQFAFDQPPAS